MKLIEQIQSQLSQCLQGEGAISALSAGISQLVSSQQRNTADILRMASGGGGSGGGGGALRGEGGAGVEHFGGEYKSKKLMAAASWQRERLQRGEASESEFEEEEYAASKAKRFKVEVRICVCVCVCVCLVQPDICTRKCSKV